MLELLVYFFLNWSAQPFDNFVRHFIITLDTSFYMTLFNLLAFVTYCGQCFSKNCVHTVVLKYSNFAVSLCCGVFFGGGGTFLFLFFCVLFLAYLKMLWYLLGQLVHFVY